MLISLLVLDNRISVNWQHWSYEFFMILILTLGLCLYLEIYFNRHIPWPETIKVIVQYRCDTRSVVLIRGWRSLIYFSCWISDIGCCSGISSFKIKPVTSTELWNILVNSSLYITRCTAASVWCSSCPTFRACRLLSMFQILWVNVRTRLDQSQVYSYFGEKSSNFHEKYSLSRSW